MSLGKVSTSILHWPWEFALNTFSVRRRAVGSLIRFHWWCPWKSKFQFHNIHLQPKSFHWNVCQHRNLFTYGFLHTWPPIFWHNMIPICFVINQPKRRLIGNRHVALFCFVRLKWIKDFSLQRRSSADLESKQNPTVGFTSCNCLNRYSHVRKLLHNKLLRNVGGINRKLSTKALKWSSV